MTRLEQVTRELVATAIRGHGMVATDEKIDDVLSRFDVAKPRSESDFLKTLDAAIR